MDQHAEGTKVESEGAQHLAAVLRNGASIVMPATAWRDQELVRRMLAHAAGAQPPHLPEEEWLRIVSLMFEAAEEVDAATAATMTKDAATRTAEVVIRPNAAPPPEKWRALMENLPRARLAADGELSDIIDRSRSGHDLALAHICRRAGWSPQETADLLRANREGLREKPKDKQYYQKTIAKAWSRRTAR